MAARGLTPGSLPGGSNDATCCLCPVRNGAFKTATDTGEWAHVVCGLWHPDLAVLPGNVCAAVQSKAAVKPDKWGGLCGVCHLGHGAVVKCSFGHCQAAFHPLCARRAGHYVPAKAGPGGRPVYRAYCAAHSDAMRERDAEAGAPRAVIDIATRAKPAGGAAAAAAAAPPAGGAAAHAGGAAGTHVGSAATGAAAGGAGSTTAGAAASGAPRKKVCLCVYACVCARVHHMFHARLRLREVRGRPPGQPSLTSAGIDSTRYKGHQRNSHVSAFLRLLSARHPVQLVSVRRAAKAPASNPLPNSHSAHTSRLPHHLATCHPPYQTSHAAHLPRLPHKMARPGARRPECHASSALASLLSCPNPQPHAFHAAPSAPDRPHHTTPSSPVAG
eukprot:8084-Chlamydomonas_euryale.AAC.1